jgi:hypothetical protein
LSLNCWLQIAAATNKMQVRIAGGKRRHMATSSSLPIVAFCRSGFANGYSVTQGLGATVFNFIADLHACAPSGMPVVGNGFQGETKTKSMRRSASFLFLTPPPELNASAFTAAAGRA